MGAGAVKGESRPAEPTTSRSETSNLNPDSKDLMMSCEQCSVNFTIFKRKKICVICRRHHCSNCLPKEPNKPSNQRRCGKCRHLSANPTRADLMQCRVKDLKLYLVGRSVEMNHCTEKNDLVELVLKHNNSAEYWQREAESQQRTNEMMSNLRDARFDNTSDPSSTSENTPPPTHRNSNGTPSQRHSNMTSSQPTRDATTSQPANETTSSDRPETQPNDNTNSANHNNFAEFSENRAQELRERQQREMREAQERLRTEWANEEQPDPRPARKFTTLNDVKDESTIDDLTIKQLKEILAANFVDYKGCCEKYELVERVRRLWDDTHKNQQKGAEQVDGASGEQELCKICMDAIIDCVLLECGHMVTCTSCGRRLNECPICRNFVVRVVHIFKA